MPYRIKGSLYHDDSRVVIESQHRLIRRIRKSVAYLRGSSASVLAPVSGRRLCGPPLPGPPVNLSVPRRRRLQSL